VRLLVVDDDRFFRELLTGMLERHGHTVTAVPSAGDALAHFQPGRFDAVLADLVLPGVGGIDLMHSLHQRAPEQEVLLVTSASDARTAVEALREGATDFITKPVDEATLLLALERSASRLSLRRERSRLLDENLEFIKHQALYRRCLELLSNLDLERLQEQALADLCQVCDAQSGALWVADERGDLQLKAYRGLVNRAKLPARVDGKRGPLAEGIAARRPFSPTGPGKDFFLPLWAGGDLVGLALLGDKLTGGFGGDDQAIARAVGDFAATALRNARRFVALERLGLRDRDTGAYNLAYFVDYAGKEAYKARRYSRAFSLLTLSIDNLEVLRAHLSGDELRAALRTVVLAMNRVCRDADVIAKSAEAELYVLLPETDLFGALMFARRALASIREDKLLADVETRAPLAISFGVATFPKDGEDFDELVHRCRARMDEGRLSLHRRLMLDGLDFWATVDLLVGSAKSPKLPVDDRGGPSRRAMLPEGIFARAQVESVRELSRDPTARGLLYVGVPEVRSDLPLLAPLEGWTESQARVYLLGRRAGLDAHPAATLVYLEGDERMQAHEFLLLHSEHASYAYLSRKGADGATFHTSDVLLVDGLVHKLQQAYDLQPF
jgi:diguanylate cyclase (GGDEF)-like protein